jgi:pilus assembly protein CpaB
MKIKTWLPIALALVLGVFAAVLAKSAISARRAAVGPQVKVVVAKRPIAPGEALAVADLEVAAIAGTVLPEGAHAKPDEIIGRTAGAQLLKGQTVLETLLAPEGTLSGLQALVPPGMRAMTIEVNEFSSVGGMITPGSRVDVIASMQEPVNSENMTRTICQNVLVKAIGNDTGRINDKGEEEKKPKSVTLLVSAKQAESIQLASLTGRPWLTLRNNNDGSIASLAGTTLAELRGAGPNIAREVFTALKNVKPVAQTTPMIASPSTQPLAAPAQQQQPMMIQPNYTPPRAIHTIRNTVEATVSVAPTTPAAAANDTVTGATIEP